VVSNPTKKVVSLIGPPGCSKTTLGREAAKLLNMAYISSGDIARQVCNTANDDRLHRGEMGPEDLVRGGVADAIHSSKHDVIIDGMPRFPGQLDWFKEEFKEYDLRFVYVNVPKTVCTERLIKRSRDNGDTEGSIIKRMDFYKANTAPMLDTLWYSEFKPAPFACSELVTIDFCRFLLANRVVEKQVKIKLLPDHPLYGMDHTAISEFISNPEHTKAFLFKKYAGDAGLDLFVTKPITIPARGKENISTSIAIEIPPFYWYAIDKRSSTFYKRDMLVVEAVIDNGYRGELFCTVHNPSDIDKIINVGESLAQIIFHELVGYDFQYHMVDELSESDRGDNGFGSTTDHKALIEKLYALNAPSEATDDTDSSRKVAI
jgi:dUTP pyrophosphatase